MAEAPNQLTPRHYAVLAIMGSVREVEQRLADNAHHSDPDDLFRSQIMVWLQRAKELLLEAVAELEAHAGDDQTP